MNRYLKLLFHFSAISLFSLLFLRPPALATACKPPAETAIGAANIEPVTSFVNVEKTANDLAKTHGHGNVLVVFDIDNTLLAARAALGSDQWFGWQECLQQNYQNSPLNAVPIPTTSNRFDDLLEAQRLLFSVGSMRVTHEDAQDILSSLRDAEIPAMILTSRGPKTRDVTRRELDNNELKFWKGFDLRNAKLPEQSGSYLPLDCDLLQAHGLTPAEGDEFKLCTTGKPRDVSFDDGIYLTAGQHKGAMLRALLAETNQWFSAIIFVDDHMHHLNGMYKAFKDHIAPENLRLFHYVGEKKRVDEFHSNQDMRNKTDEDWREIAAATCKTMETWCQIDPISSKQDERTDGNIGISIMSYNVENLFDNEDDLNNDGDATYLPLSEKGTPSHEAICAALSSEGFRRLCRELDWNDDVLEAKLKNIGKAIASFGAGFGPDIVILQEVENKAIVKRLRDEYLDNLEYMTIETFDSKLGRGIDVAIMSRFPVADGLTAKSHPVDLSNVTGVECGITRDILEVPLELPSGDILSVFGVHFPSPRNPKECRDETIRQLNALQSALPEGSMAVVGGDFNITCRPEQQPTLSEFATKNWILSGEPSAGCDAPGSNFFFDRNGPSGDQATWSFLDIIMGSKNLHIGYQNGPNWFLNLGSFGSHIATEEQINVNNRGQVKPKRFSPKGLEGTSDHWPVVIELLPR